MKNQCQNFLGEQWTKLPKLLKELMIHSIEYLLHRK